MKAETKLTMIKSVHTVIWLFFNFVIFYMLYAAIVNKLDLWLWLGYALILLEGMTLLIFKSMCPVTILARNYSDSAKANFDIYLPEWLARNNKLIYSLILIFVIVITSLPTSYLIMIIKEIAGEECRRILTEKRVGRIACARDNQPYVVPFHFGVV